MRFSFAIFLTILFISVGVFAQKDTSALDKVCGIKSCKIVYKFSLGPQNGVKTVIFDDWGNTVKEEVTTFTDTIMMRNIFRSIPDSMGNIPIPDVQHNLIIKTSNQLYSIDLDKHIGYKRNSISFHFGPDFFKKDEVIVGIDTIVGKPCQIVEMQHAFRVWIWEKISLKKQPIPAISDGVKVEEYATEIDDGYVIKADEFKIPSNIKIQ